MGSGSSYHEVTITDISSEKDSGNVVIETSPVIYNHGFSLKRNNPRFSELYGKLAKHETLCFCLNSWSSEIHDIVDVIDRTIDVNILSTIDIEKEYRLLNDYVEIITKKYENKRYLIRKDYHLPPPSDNKYRLRYHKAFGLNLYHVTSIEKIDDKNR
jgi:hypothetical protein